MKAGLLVRVTLLAATMAVAVPVFAAADPTMHEVYLAAEAGKFTEAQAMMDQILRDHPNSAKAHFVEAELLAKQGKLSAAEEQLRNAEKLAPGLPFAKAGAVANLRTLITRSPATPSPNYNRPGMPAPASNGGVPWGWLFVGAGLIGFVVFASRFMARRQSQAQVYAPAGMTGYAPGAPLQGYGPIQGGSMMQPQGGSLGSGIVGGLATGAAMGAGIVAGEALMHHFTDGNRNSERLRNDTDYQPAPPRDDRLQADDMGGTDFGVNDNSSWDDSSGGGSSDDWN